MDAKYAYSLNLKNFIRIRFDKYEKNFAFIVNGKRFETNRFVADVISPNIMKLHYIDESINEYSLNTKNTNEYFSEFLNITNFESVELDETRQNIFSEYFLQLGNIEEYFQLQPNLFKELTTTNIVDHLLKIKENSNFIELSKSDISEEGEILYCSYIKKMIDFCSENFNDISKEELFKLDASMIEEIIRNKNLKLEDEDKLLEFLIELYKKNTRYSFLFEYVYFNQVGVETLSNFIDVFDIENINNGIWKSICKLILKSPEKRQSIDNENQTKNESNKDEIIEIQHKEGQDLNGLMKFLVDKTGGNIHDKGTVEFKANSMANNSNDYHPKNLVDYNRSNAYQANGTSIELQFDFKSRQVQLTSYSIRTNGSRHLRNWIIESSNDSINWEKIDEHSNDASLKNNNTITFNIKNTSSFSRYIRLRETGKNSDNDYYTFFYNIEFYGKMKQPLQ